MKHRLIEGRINYLSKKPEMLNQARGFETFSFSHHANGGVIMRAHCEIEEPDPSVMRDIILEYDEIGTPRNLHVHLCVGDEYMGSGWFHFDRTKNHIECESHGPQIGRVSQTMSINKPFDGFGSHPIAGDGYLTKCIDTSKGPHKRYVRVFLPSPDHRGASPPLISQIEIGLEYVGDEVISTPAGEFACRHFRFIDDIGEGMGGKKHPAYDMWITADKYSIFVKGGVGGYMQTYYELIELRHYPPLEPPSE